MGASVASRSPSTLSFGWPDVSDEITPERLQALADEIVIDGVPPYRWHPVVEHEQGPIKGWQISGRHGWKRFIEAENQNDFFVKIGGYQAAEVFSWLPGISAIEDPLEALELVEKALKAAEFPTLTIAEGVRVETDDFWYDLFDGGYIKPEEVLLEGADKVQEAVELLRFFRTTLEESDVLEYH